MFRMVCSCFHLFSWSCGAWCQVLYNTNVFAVMKCSLLTYRAARWQSSLRASSIGKRRIMCSEVASYSCLQCDAKIGDMMQCSPSTLGGCKCDANKIGCCSFCHANWSDSDAFVIEKPSDMMVPAFNHVSEFLGAIQCFFISQGLGCICFCWSAQIKMDGIIRRGA